MTKFMTYKGPSLQSLQDWDRQIFHVTHGNKHGQSCKMRKQRNMFQLKEQDKNPEKNLNEIRVKLLDKEFKEMVIQMLIELRRKWIYTGRTSTKR